MKSIPIALVLIASFVFLAACQTSDIRQSDEEFNATPELVAEDVTDIVVMPIDVGPAVEAEAIVERQLPARQMREMIRRYLIERKNYAAPDETWIDDTMNGSGELDTDAIMNVSVLQWDTSSLENRGVIYVSAKFELLSPNENRRLWHYACQDYQLVVDGPFGGQAVGGNNISAARLLAETALSRLPRK